MPCGILSTVLQAEWDCALPVSICQQACVCVCVCMYVCKLLMGTSKSTLTHQTCCVGDTPPTHTICPKLMLKPMISGAKIGQCQNYCQKDYRWTLCNVISAAGVISRASAEITKARSHISHVTQALGLERLVSNLLSDGQAPTRRKIKDHLLMNNVSFGTANTSWDLFPDGLKSQCRARVLTSCLACV